MKKKIMALLAAIATVFGLGFGASTAMAAPAVPYAPAIQGTVTYDSTNRTLTATIDSDGAVDAGYKYVYAQYDSTLVSSVELAAAFDHTQYVGEAKADVFTVRIHLTDKAVKNATKIYVKFYMCKTQKADPTAEDIQNWLASGEALQVKGTEQDLSVSFNIPQVGEQTESSEPSGSTAKTGAAVAPYIVAVLLLAAAGIALMAVRKSTTR